MAPHTHIPAPRNTIETYSSRPEREPPRNDNGDIICTHDACRDKVETFRRPCEWNKHMDKHERPYKCSEPTCEQNPGFTYSGGLLRHMREVHKKGVGPARRPLYCPHANCIRSTGEGFTRRENLEEHLRRRHSYTGHYSPPPQSTDSNQEDTPDQPRKRRKTTDPESPTGDQLTRQAQYQSQQLPVSQRESLRTELQAMVDDRSFIMGDGELDQAEANRQLILARNTIAAQQKVISEQEQQLHNVRIELQNATAGTPYSTRPPDRSFAAPAIGAASLPAAPYRADSTTPIPQVNGNSHATATIPTDPRLEQETAVQLQQHKTDKDSQPNGSEPSRRIEIARDLVSEKLASKAS